MIAPSPHHPPRRALLVVADPVMRQRCRATLGSAGFAVANDVASGTAAVATAREQLPEIIILSQQLSDVPADEAVRWLRSNRDLASTPIIILGGKADAEEMAAGQHVIIVPRPVTAALIRHALDEALPGEPPARQAAP